MYLILISKLQKKKVKQNQERNHFRLKTVDIIDDQDDDWLCKFCQRQVLPFHKVVNNIYLF